MAARVSRSLSRPWNNAAAHNGASYRTIITSLLFFAFLVTAGLLLRSGSRVVPVGTTVDAEGSEDSQHSYAHNILAVRSSGTDPDRIRAQQLFKQAKERLAITRAYAGVARQGKLNMTKVVNVFSEQADSYAELLARAENKALLESDEVSEEHYRKFETDVKELFRLTREAILDSKHFFDDELNIQRLEDQLFQTNYQLSKVKKIGAVASLIAAKSVPKSLHCLSMRLMALRVSQPDLYRPEEPLPQFEDPNLYHYAIFSDSVIGTAVAVHSTVKNTKNTKKHVFHIVTNKMNVAAMQVWFKKRAPSKAHVEVKSVDDFKFLKSSYVPLLRQLESPEYLQYYYKNVENTTVDSSRLMFGNPKHLMLSYLKFYLPEMYPKLSKILFLDDDVVVQKDLTPLWDINLGGNVNGAVETCYGSVHTLDKYLNFDNPLISSRFDPSACGWAFGMNIFDLDAWKRHKSTEEYHRWQNLNKDHTLWKLGTLPPGLLTFYKTTKPLDRSWHVLGLGYNPNISIVKIKNAAVIHYNGNMKPWLDIALPQYKEYWTKYVDYNMDAVQMCNIEK